MEGIELILSYGIDYDHSMSRLDCQTHCLWANDGWTKINYSQKVKSWLKPMVKGKEIVPVEIPGSCYINDLPLIVFMQNSANSHGWVHPRFVEIRCPHDLDTSLIFARDVEDVWRDHLDYFYREYGDTIQPCKYLEHEG